MSSFLSEEALKAALLTNRGVAITGDAGITVCDDTNAANTGFAAGQDPVLRFAYTFKTTADTSTFFVGFRTAGDTDFTPGYGVTITRDGSAATAELANTWTGAVDVVNGDGVVYVAIKPNALETLDVALEIAVDLNGGDSVILHDLRYDLFG